MCINLKTKLMTNTKHEMQVLDSPQEQNANYCSHPFYEYLFIHDSTIKLTFVAFMQSLHAK